MLVTVSGAIVCATCGGFGTSFASSISTRCASILLMSVMGAASDCRPLGAILDDVVGLADGRGVPLGPRLGEAETGLNDRLADLLRLLSAVGGSLSGLLPFSDWCFASSVGDGS